MKANNEPFHPATLPQTLLELHQNLVQQPSPEAAWAIIKEYFFFFGDAGPRADMWQMLSAALTHKEMPILKKPVNRQNLIFFYEFTLVFMDAVAHLQQERKLNHPANETE